MVWEHHLKVKICRIIAGYSWPTGVGEKEMAIDVILHPLVRNGLEGARFENLDH